MNINFDKTDRLIQIIDEAVRVLNSAEYNLGRAFKLKNSPNEKPKKLYDELVKITSNKNISEDEKRQNKITVYSIAYNCDEEKACSLLEEHCNFTDFSKWVCKVYWEIQPYITFNSQNDNSVEGWIKFLGKHYKGEKYLESIANVIINNEPRVKDIENEFWMNCTDVLSIDSFCNIYCERWRNHLYCIKETDFDMDAMLFDDKNRLHQLFAELLRCGFITEKEKDYILTKLYHLAHATNYVCESIVELLKKLRASAISATKESKEATETANSPIVAKSSKVQLVAIIEILRVAGIDKSNTDLTKIVRIAAFIMGKSYKGLYNDANKGISFNKSFHQKDIDEINQLFKDVNSAINIDINKDY